MYRKTRCVTVRPRFTLVNLTGLPLQVDVLPLNLYELFVYSSNSQAPLQAFCSRGCGEYLSLEALVAGS